jgi:DNA-binding winged helix-turn-helix (wHTH) protein/DNA-binding CsgD family transcriptional regulator
VPEIRIDQSRRCVYWEGREVAITPQEYRVLYCLASHAEEVVSKQTLLAAMWATGGCTEDALSTLTPTAVDLVIFRLRKKLADDPQQPTYLETRRGFGYILHHAQVINGSQNNQQNERSTQNAKTAPAPVTRLMSTALDQITEPWSTLTRREWELFLLLGDEAATRLTNGALARQLRMAEGTLKKHLQNIYRKLGVENRSAAALLAMRVRVHLLPGANR